MAKNLEIKIALSNPSACIAKLSDLKSESFTQEDTYVNYSNGRLKLRKYDNGKRQLIFYKRANKENLRTSEFKIHTYKTSEAFAIAYKNFKKNLGFNGRVKKERQYFRYKSCRIHIDKVEGIGQFLEIESVVKGKSEKKNRDEVNYLLNELLSLSNAKRIPYSYIDLVNGTKDNVPPSTQST